MNAKQRNTRDQRIIELRARGLSLEAIGQEVGLTRERVRQITDGRDIPRRFTTLPELMGRFGVQRYEVMKAMKAVGGLAKHGRLGQAPASTQHLEQAGRQHGQTFPPSLAGADAKDHALRIDIASLPAPSV
jgi:hypothetical protein